MAQIANRRAQNFHIMVVTFLEFKQRCFHSTLQKTGKALPTQQFVIFVNYRSDCERYHRVLVVLYLL
jgi:hypothetical protein